MLLFTSCFNFPLNLIICIVECFKHVSVFCGNRRYSSDPSTFADRFVHLTNAAIQREHTASASAADSSSTAFALPQSHATTSTHEQQQPPTQPPKQPEHLDFLFPNDASLAGGSKISLAQWRALMTEAGFVFMFTQFALQSICLLLLCP